MGGPKYLDQNYYFRYYGTTNYEHGTLTEIIHNTWVENNHFSHGFPFINHKALTVDEWEAQNILTKTITTHIMGLLTMDMVH